jgi:hypothetical protein
VWRALGNLQLNSSTSATRSAIDGTTSPGSIAPAAANAGGSTRGLDRKSSRQSSTTEYANPNASAGSCSCLCPPGMGFGSCFNLPDGATPEKDCSSVMQYGNAVCPAHGQPRQCHTPALPEDTNCTAVRLGWGANTVGCTLTEACKVLPGAGTRRMPPENTNFRFATCTCQPQVFQSCSWSPAQCIYSPFFPPYYP